MTTLDTLAGTLGETLDNFRRVFVDYQCYKLDATAVRDARAEVAAAMRAVLDYHHGDIVMATAYHPELLHRAARSARTTRRVMDRHIAGLDR